MLKAVLSLTIFFFFLQISKAQSGQLNIRQVGDTLFVTGDKRIFKGQTLVIGNGSEKSGWYEYIGFKNYTALPLLINREADLKYNYNGRSNPEQERANDLVKTCLHPGDSVIVKKIKRIREKHLEDWYKVTIVPKKSPKIRFYCNVEKALNYNEISVP